MWTLNDESGGIGWGSPEVMGEILAAHKGLAEIQGRIDLDLYPRRHERRRRDTGSQAAPHEEPGPTVSHAALPIERDSALPMAERQLSRQRERPGTVGGVAASIGHVLSRGRLRSGRYEDRGGW